MVGPNGSGKSNVVDALAWVMGEQGAKSLRGGKMEDVIFSGTSGRAPLGRAEVSLTIDNSDGALPIEFSEVTISRTLFRNGGSEYAINGESCRLLDVQELLSDSGIGREMHVIVGQGQLDSILKATPEDRRGFIEEAAGVLKHRKRKEKALRKLDSMQANLIRLNDLTSELRRQLKPLGRQAEVARRATVIQSDVRDSRLRLMADDLIALKSSLAAEVADESALRARQNQVESDLAVLREREALAEDVERELDPRLRTAQQQWFDLSGLRERLSGLAQLGEEKVRNLAPEPLEEQVGRDPDQIEAEARTLRSSEFELKRNVEELASGLIAATKSRAESEEALHNENQRIAGVEAKKREYVAELNRIAGALESVQSKIDARTAEVQRLETQIAEAEERSRVALTEFQRIETQVVSHGDGEEDLDRAFEEAQTRLKIADSHVHELMAEESHRERERAGLRARTEALAMSLERKDGTASLAEAPGYLGTLTSLIHVEPGFETAVAAALGELADSVVVSGLSKAIDSLVLLKSTEAGRSRILVASGSEAFEHDLAETDAPRVEDPPHIERSILEVVHPDKRIEHTVRTILKSTRVVHSLEELRSSVSSNAGITYVTIEGDVASAEVVVGGSSAGPSLLEVQVAHDEAQEALSNCEIAITQIAFQLAKAKAEQAEAAETVASALTLLHQSDAEHAAIAEKLGALGQTSRSASAEADRLKAALDAAKNSLAADRQKLNELTENHQKVKSNPAPDIEDDRRDEIASQISVARAQEVEARLAVRTAEERVRAVGERAAALEKDAREERRARVAAVERREKRAAALIVAQSILRGVRVALAYSEVSANLAQRNRTALDLRKREVDSELSNCRSEIKALSETLAGLKDSVHRDEVARAEQRMRIESLELKAREEFGVEADTLIEEYGPDQPVPPSPVAPGDDIDPHAPEPQPYPFVREEQEKRLKTAEKQLALLGRVNPLALEEYSAMEERQRFLTEQLDDLKRTRDDLLDIVKEVDSRVEQVFTEAYRDIEREFEGVFARLFPGGEGRLVLTDPENMLTTGVDVEARPPGKKVKRLSLLSGGERSLTAVAFLVSLFKARPSPFYVLDEVEAALDDVNLGRLIDIIEELRSSSQLIVITHQKRTMEIADALYGVSMRGDGVTQVIGQRLRETESVGA